MLYKKNSAPTLSEELFRKPTSEYRGAPFWAWNCKLDKEELLRQIDVLNSMGFGGFHMHVRSGMDTPYLSDEFMDLIKSCVDKAKSNEMLAWLYDEDRWPSGFAGGFVTEDPKYRMRYLMFTTTPIVPQKAVHSQLGNEQNHGKRTGMNNKLLATYDVQLDENGCLAKYRRLAEGETPVGQIWYASVESPHENPRYNGTTYSNTLDKAAMKRFIEVTHERYKEVVGDEFDKTIPAIFSDEPQTTAKQTLKFAADTSDIAMAFTDDLEDTFVEAYGVSLLDHLPEIFWELPDGQISQIRYFYHDHIAERLAQGFGDTVGGWCKENGIALTGHMMHEATLESQTTFIGECMRNYRGFGLPGIDMLVNRKEYNTAKQAQSAAHQQGAEGVLDEIYGITSWDFDFRGHKNYGDWQAALGVTSRVPHLAWVSMEGESKRDYPASLNYQSPWHKEYSYVEDHFARVNTAMTRGKPLVKVGVIHPIESFWLHWGPAEQTAAVREQMDRNFADLTNWLIFGSIDFDFICESTLPTLCPEGGAPLQVGQMAYDVVLVPGCENLRPSTLERLKAFQAAGGKLIFMGDAPRYVNALPSDEPAKLYEMCEKITFDRNVLLGTLAPYRTVEIRNASGALSDDLLYNMRQDGEVRWLFIARGKEPYNKDICTVNEVYITITGEYQVTLYDTLTGDIKKIPYSHKNGNTIVPAKLYDYDSLLLHLVPSQEVYAEEPSVEKTSEQLVIPHAVPFTLDEPNAMVLDMATWSIDDEPANPLEQILRIDTAVRTRFGWTPWGGAANQPWKLSRQAPCHTLHLRYTFDSEIEYTAPQLAIENPQNATIRFNGKPVDTTVLGWYVDKAIRTIQLPDVVVGENVLEVDIPYGEKTAAENMYLLGQFGVRAEGRCSVVTRLPDKLYFGSIVPQGLPFYSGKITYHFEMQTNDGELVVTVPQYRASLLRVKVGEDDKPLVLAPYTVRFDVKAGYHKVDIDTYIPRTNGFSPLHCADRVWNYEAPRAWRTQGDKWCYEYQLKPEGILVSPIFKIEK